MKSFLELNWNYHWAQHFNPRSNCKRLLTSYNEIEKYVTMWKIHVNSSLFGVKWTHSYVWAFECAAHIHPKYIAPIHRTMVAFFVCAYRLHTHTHFVPFNQKYQSRCYQKFILKHFSWCCWLCCAIYHSVCSVHNGHQQHQV